MVLYTITGYSYGGVVTFEIAKQLEAMGKEVKFFSSINIPPNISDCMCEFNWMATSLNLSAFLDRVSRYDADDLLPSTSLLTRQQQLKFVWTLSPPERVIKLWLTLEKLDKWTNIAMSLINCGVD
ncbi:hypothetical protein BDR06DRAFT_1037485 [Suillus hirtellus]|nr:hypothetical protein BDR06DRAFT_1037485 [Suillus hirtellus]